MRTRFAKRAARRRECACSDSRKATPGPMGKGKGEEMGKRKSHAPKARSKANRGLPKDAVTLVVNLRAREGQELVLEAELRALVGPTRREQGCLTYDVYRGTELPGAFLLHEVWASREDHRL